ncbi:YdbL family protein [Desulforhopalus singaporensis]|nr:DUF1318 domain-containing protein [Desulforhopalus singaporensis]
MAARQPAITSLKDQGIIGENNSGFLEFLGSKKDASTVAEENRDRGMVYDAIAKKQGVDAALVGARRAKMNAERGPKGHWFEKADGKWYKK